MPFFQYENIRVEVDEDGFLESPDEWDQDIAKALATSEDVYELSKDHWILINYLREY